MIPTGCTSGSLGVSYDKLFRMTFNSPQVPILAVISKDPVGSMVSYFGTGTTQVRRVWRGPAGGCTGIGLGRPQSGLWPFCLALPL